MPCHHCTSARRASKLALQAIAQGDIREGATRAKEAHAHIKAKLSGDEHRRTSRRSEAQGDI